MKSILAYFWSPAPFPRVLRKTLLELALAVLVIATVAMIVMGGL
jgi:hypothetical protein